MNTIKLILTVNPVKGLVGTFLVKGHNVAASLIH